MQISEQHSDLYKKMFVSFELSLKSLFFGRKWIIYTLLALMPLVFTLLTHDRLFGYGTIENAYIEIFIRNDIGFFFTFGCLIISLPFSADEITDHLIDLYIVRPIPRESLYLSRWLAYHLALIIVNIFIAVFYFLFLHIVTINTSGGIISGLSNLLELMFNNLNLLSSSIILILYASIAYGGLFLIIGFIGNRAFTLGVIVALFERFFLSLLFLVDEPYIPLTNISTIASNLFGNLYTYNPSKEVPDFILSQIYLIFLGIVFLFLGLFFIRRKEFE